MKSPSLTLAACLALLLTSPASLRADDVEPPRFVREFHFERVNVKEANAIIRSLLNVRKAAVDERRQVLLLSDAPEVLDQAAVLAAQIDQASPEWTLSLVARTGQARVVLRTANISMGRLQVQFGPAQAGSADNLAISAVTHRATSGEVELEWSASLALSDLWLESAQATETLHDRGVITLLQAAVTPRKAALAQMLGLGGEVDSLVLEIAKVDDAQRSGTRLGR